MSIVFLVFPWFVITGIASGKSVVDAKITYLFCWVSTAISLNVTPLLFYFQSFHTSFVEFHVLVFTTNVHKYWIATWYLMPSEGAPIQKINHIESSFWGLCKAVRNAIADSPTGRSLQSLYIAPPYICWVQIFALLFYRTSITFAVSVLIFLTVTCSIDGLYLAMQTLSLP